MSTLDDINALLPDNILGEISPEDVRGCFALTFDDLKKSYDFQKEGETAGGAIAIVDDTYQTVCELITPTRVAGTYQFLVSMNWDYNTISKSAYYRWSIDGGATWKENSIETKDKTNIENFSYVFPKVLSNGPIHMILQARKEAANDVMTVHHANLVVERKI